MSFTAGIVCPQASQTCCDSFCDIHVLYFTFTQLNKLLLLQRKHSKYICTKCLNFPYFKKFSCMHAFCMFYLHVQIGNCSFISFPASFYGLPGTDKKMYRRLNKFFAYCLVKLHSYGSILGISFELYYVVLSTFINTFYFGPIDDTLRNLAYLILSKRSL